MGAHTVGEGANYNKEGIGVCFAGDFTREMPTKAQIVAWKNLGVEITIRWPIEKDKILNHRDVKPTACPGYDFKQELLDHLDMIEGPQNSFIRTWVPTFAQQLSIAYKAIKRVTNPIRKRALERKIKRLERKVGDDKNDVVIW